MTIGKEKRLDILISKRFSLYFLLQLKHHLLEDSAREMLFPLWLKAFGGRRKPQ
ncbi:hypothetical protein [Halobacillus seohaensis]|uniref:hypothetical protein n=1 Tax=Halobacillus seohaensis TaxID=447421 RepID=UPI0036F3D99B